MVQSTLQDESIKCQQTESADIIQVQLTASKVQPGQCSFCSLLCKKSSPRYTHPIAVKEKQREGYMLTTLDALSQAPGNAR